jgi:hypothetical protein
MICVHFRNAVNYRVMNYLEYVLHYECKLTQGEVEEIALSPASKLLRTL